MKVLIVASAARSLVNFRGPLIGHLVARGWEVLAAAPDPTDEIRSKLRRLGAGFRQVSIHRAGINPMRDFGTLVELRRLLQDERPDIVITYTIKPIIYTGLAARTLSGGRFFAMITGLGYTFGKTEGLKQRVVGRITKVLYRLALRRYEGVMFQNPDDQHDFQRAGLLPRGIRSTRINGSGVDLVYFAPVELPEEVSFLMIGRLLREKGVNEYIAAARQLKQRFPHVCFKLVGAIDPNPSSLTAAQLQELEAEGVVKYLGRMEDVRPAIADASVYVLPSYREGTPRTVLEAMAMGRPIITTDAPGCRETVTPGVNGVLVPPKNADALAAAMENFITKPEMTQEMGRASLVTAREKFDADEVAGSIIGFIGEPAVASHSRGGAVG
ncbi:glycosyltransferase family 4 protein [Luteimonas sp. MJ293]|uniref:glycosyltransferase family 4 protein n=1 Tax=Luteimonas sp. MJ146 TaxID=3129240 RepID=UPI0031BA78CD